MKIVLSGFYGLGNTGDEAILKAIVDNLRSELNNPEITVFSLSPEQTAKEHGVKSIYRGWRHQNKEKVKALRDADLLISGGGGLLQDTYPTKFLFGPLPYYLLIVLLAKLCGSKVMFFSQGIGPVTSTWGKILMKSLANLADFVTVRDQYSKDYLHSLGVKRPETVVTADIVFAFRADEEDSAYQSLPLKGDEKIVAVTVRPWFEHPDYIEKMAHLLDELIVQRGVTPVFVPMEGKYDVPASNEVLSHMKHADKTFMLGSEFSPNQFLNFIRHSDLTVGLRLHALIFSALSNVPHLGFSYDKKVESFLIRSGMWDYSFRLGEIDEVKLLENALYLLDNKELAQQKMKPNVDQLRREAMRNLDLLKEKFGNYRRSSFMKILLVTSYDYPHLGGLSTHMTTLQSGLQARGHEVDTLSFSDVPKWKRDFIARGPSFILNKMSLGAGYVWTLERRQDFLEQMLREEKYKAYDIVNAQDVFATRASLAAGLPTVTTVHGYLTYEGISKGSVAEGSKHAEKLMAVERIGYTTTREVITVDTRIKNYVKRETGIDGTMIKNFIDVDSFKPEIEHRREFRDKYGINQDELIFFVPRRLTRKNGVIYPVLSFPPVLEKFPNARIVFAGTGEMFEEIKAKAVELGVADNVTLLGAVAHKDMIEYFALSDVVLVPSILSAGVEEATSISALEAMGSGVPLIACAVGGLKEIVDHEKDGLLVEEQNVEDLSNAMIYLLENPQEGSQLAVAARTKIIEQYSHYAAAEKYESIYKRAVSK